MNTKHITEVIEHWEKHGEIDCTPHATSVKKRLSKARGDVPSWNFEQESYAVPADYQGPFGHVVWIQAEAREEFQPSPDGDFVRKSDYLNLLRQYNFEKEEVPA